MSNSKTLIETIRIENGRVRHIDYHNERCNHSRKLLFGSKNRINLRSSIDTKQASTSKEKCRITYDHKVQKVEYVPYKLKSITSLKAVEVGDYKYNHKYADRDLLKEFFETRDLSDDILLTKKGMLTDTYYANIALLKEGSWYTPEDPLLKGTMRQYLLDKGTIIPKPIHIDDLSEYESIRLFNAMILFGEIELSVDRIN